MPELLDDIVQFRGDRLFNGAVNLDWLHKDEARSNLAANAFVFHGPAYHGVSQADVGESHGHQLQDTARFTESIIKRCYGLEDQPFTLAIAGYGTGKSHLALTLGTLLRNPTGSTADAIVRAIETADTNIGNNVKCILHSIRQPNLVVAINGMQSFDLTAEVTRQVMEQVTSANLDSRPLSDLRPRFDQAANLIEMAETNAVVMGDLLSACGAASITDIKDQLRQQNEQIYHEVHRILASINVNISAFGGESVRDVINVVTREYCGEGKHFHSLVVVFDEFGRYTEFATVKSHVAGIGVLQDLFEGIQAHAEKACFVGFIQFELNAYVQRVASEHRNEILRYITRYQSASRAYLSINLETLIANLIEKKKPDVLDRFFTDTNAQEESKELIENIARWFPQSSNHTLWSDLDKFHNVIRKGCWPLSAYSTWFLFYISAGGKHLQERSALALLGDLFHRLEHQSFHGITSGLLAPVDFWSDSLQQELITAEESGQQGSITHSYASIVSRHGSHFSNELKRLLRAIVIASKLGLKSSDKDDAIEAIAELAGLHLREADQAVQLLQDEFNVLEWDDSFRAFDILGDAVPRTQFLAFLRQRVASSYDETGKAKLFASKATTWCDLLKDLECDFAEENKITTREWRYLAETSNIDILLMQFTQAMDRWKSALAVDEPRGTVIFCYVEPSRDIESTKKEASRFLKNLVKDTGFTSLPIWVLFLHDEDGVLGRSLAEMAVLEESLSESDRSKYGNLIGAHKEKTLEIIRSRIDGMIKKRHYVSSLGEALEPHRPTRYGTGIFSTIYKHPITFPFDGFSTAKGNAADTCRELTAELIQGRLDWSGIISKPKKDQNRAESVLKTSWGIFAQNGDVKIRPSHPIIRKLTEEWDEMLNAESQRIHLKDAIIQLCRPPHGANIASAGLFLGVFIAARTSKLMIMKGGNTMTLPEWMQHHDPFGGKKYIDVNGLRDVYLVLSGDASSEWESLLDEWEQAESYGARRDWYVKSEQLKNRLPLPPAQAYRKLHLEELGKSALIKLQSNEKKQEEANNKINTGMDRRDVALLSWGSALLFRLIDDMSSQKPLWSNYEIEKLKPSAERARQALVDIFPDWLRIQLPRNMTPEVVGEFKHKMIDHVGGNLKTLKLDELFEALVKHTNEALRKAETLASRHKLVSEVQLWMTSHAQATHFVRVAELRSLHKTGSEFSNKLRAASSHVELPGMNELRIQLSKRLNEIKKAEDIVTSRATNLWQTQILTVDDVNKLLYEVEELLPAFEGCREDLDDLRLMQRSLQSYVQVFQQLNSDHLTDGEFESLANRLKSDVSDVISDDEPPWDPVETIEGFRKMISGNRCNKSQKWIESLEQDTKGIESLDATGLNSLYGRTDNPPAFLSETHHTRLNKIKKTIEIHSGRLKVEWLIERFSELSPDMKQQFLSRIKNGQ